MLQIPSVLILSRKQTANAEPLTTFDCINGIIGRMIPFRSLYVLDFVWANGTRVKDQPDWGVWDVAESPVQINPIGKLEEHRDFSQYYYISKVRIYEVRKGSQVIKSLHFP